MLNSWLFCVLNSNRHFPCVGARIPRERERALRQEFRPDYERRFRLTGEFSGRCALVISMHPKINSGSHGIFPISVCRWEVHELPHLLLRYQFIFLCGAEEFWSIRVSTSRLEPARASTRAPQAVLFAYFFLGICQWQCKCGYCYRHDDSAAKHTAHGWHRIFKLTC